MTLIITQPLSRDLDGQIEWLEDDPMDLYDPLHTAKAYTRKVMVCILSMRDLIYFPIIWFQMLGSYLMLDTKIVKCINFLDIAVLHN